MSTNESGTTLRMVQHRVLADPAHCLELARLLVMAKIESQQQGTRHYQRQGRRPAGKAGKHLKRSLAQARRASRLDELRGIEGAATAAWFELFGQLLKSPWRFPGRNRRPPRDPVNALLSLGYTWLLHRIQAKIQAHGLELNLGALHEYRAGRPSLACDLMEPFRLPAVDRWVLAICNRDQLAPADFVQTKEGTRLNPKRFGPTVTSWEQHWQSRGMDKVTDKAIERWIGEIRRRWSNPPTPS